jgi:hypothetical protein
MTLKRILYVIAAVLFVLAWLVALGTIESDSAALGWQALIALGLAVGFSGHAV